MKFEVAIRPSNTSAEEHPWRFERQFEDRIRALLWLQCLPKEMMWSLRPIGENHHEVGYGMGLDPEVARQKLAEISAKTPEMAQKLYLNR